MNNFIKNLTESGALASITAIVVTLIMLAFLAYGERRQTKTMLDLYDKKEEVQKTVLKEQIKELCTQYNIWKELVQDNVERMDKFCE